MGIDKMQNALLYKILTWGASIMILALLTYLTSTAMGNRERIVRLEVAQLQYVETQKDIISAQNNIILKLDLLSLQINTHSANTEGVIKK